MPEQERFLDTKRLNNVKAKFNAKNYDNGQYRYEKRGQLYMYTLYTLHSTGATRRSSTARPATSG